MKRLKLKRVYLIELAIAVTISLGLGCILGMKVFSHLYRLSGINSKSIMHLNKRIDFLEQSVKRSEQNDVKPVSL